MGSFDLPRRAGLDEAAVARFQANGFFIVERVLDEDRIAALRERFSAGQFDTGV